MEIRGLTVGEMGIGLAGVGGGIVPERLLVEDLIFPSEDTSWGFKMKV